MRSEDVIGLIHAGFPEAEIHLDGADCNFSVRVVSDGFQGKSTVKRHQAVIATVKDKLASGELHAMSVAAYTRVEWKQKLGG